jgi:transcriptional regulator with XRE-family HTH domain
MITGNQLRLLRLSSGQTQSELAEKLGNGGYSKQVVMAIEKGKRNIGLSLLADWASACGYDVSISFTKSGTAESEIEETSQSDFEKMVEKSGAFLE